jgi:glyoxylase-like metal-dependent hydrolase (beta-lactamase superfamily II)
MTRWIGGIQIDRVVESEGAEFLASFLLPDATPENLEPHRHWFEPRFLDPATQKLVMCVQTYVLRTGGHTILVDTCVGNHKKRRFHPDWNERTSSRWLDELSAVGVKPEEVDYVMCTHLHTDHVGWNTKLLNGRWVPTFPNAKYVIARREWAYWEELNKKGAKYSDGSINDSVLPVIEAGQTEFVESDFQFNDQLHLEATPGHTPGHVSVNLTSNGQTAVISGDILHSPIQCLQPDWCSAGCIDKEVSRRTRRAFLDRHCETNTLVLTAHFPSPSAGFIRRSGDAFHFDFEPPSA